MEVDGSGFTTPLFQPVYLQKTKGVGVGLIEEEEKNETNVQTLI